ncbi:TIGR03936 family radical SAM-associated protein [Rhodopirellula sp. JC740]|uniref:TIGR03936 family radical SAM-associated protein n=1 Tax=Rhodopirellula halodulae TaxID=2894198 RepID=A0ABS8NK72_9BACT|nr:TIGR03936 family radical SAM-associated protein [Rhodopirellula sp. JC740]MCC9643960.1 TIGR03936 family radical SAM-associated protein [Rhodopirellula sp. JC740]
MRTRPSRQSPNVHPADQLRIRYRVRFAKTGLLRWISHRDLALLFERVARRVTLPLSMTEGFHPTPRIAFPSALPLGIESLDEVAEIDLCEDLAADELLERLRSDEQPGLTIHSVEKIPEGVKKARIAATQYTVSLPDDWDESQRAEIDARIANLKQEESVSVERKGKTVTAIVDEHLPTIELQDNQLFARMVLADGASLKMQDLLDLLGLGNWPERGANIVRTAVELQEPQRTKRS